MFPRVGGGRAGGAVSFDRLQLQALSSPLNWAGGRAMGRRLIAGGDRDRRRRRGEGGRASLDWRSRTMRRRGECVCEREGAVKEKEGRKLSLASHFSTLDIRNRGERPKRLVALAKSSGKRTTGTPQCSSRRCRCPRSGPRSSRRRS